MDELSANNKPLILKCITCGKKVYGRTQKKAWDYLRDHHLSEHGGLPWDSNYLPDENPED